MKKPTSYNSQSWQTRLFSKLEEKPSIMLVSTDSFIQFLPIDGPEDISFENFKQLMNQVNGDFEYPKDITLEVVTAVNLSSIADVAITAFIDEDGVDKNLPLNAAATAFVGQPILGPAIFINSALYLAHEEEDSASGICTEDQELKELEENLFHPGSNGDEYTEDSDE